MTIEITPTTPDRLSDSNGHHPAPDAAVRYAAFVHLSEQRRAQRLRGAGSLQPTYLVEDAEMWSGKFANSENALLLELDDQITTVLDICHQLGRDVLAQYTRDSGPTRTDQDYYAHGYRTAMGVYHEFGINDPLVIATAFLHDLYQVVVESLPISQHESQIKARAEAARHLVKYYITSNFTVDIGPYAATEFQEQLLANLEDLYQLEQAYQEESIKIVDHYPELATIADEGSALAPTEFMALQDQIIEDFIRNGNGASMLLDLEGMMRYAIDNFGESNSQGGTTSTKSKSPAGVAVTVTLLAEAVDNYRYPRLDWDHIVENPAARLRALRHGVIYNLFLGVLARNYNLPVALKDLGEVVYKAFYPKQWAAFETALRELGTYQSKRGTQNAFEMQRRMSSMALHTYIEDTLSELGIPATFVSETELEYRSIQAIQNVGTPILEADEYAIYTDVKNPASIFEKWISYAVRGRLNRYGAVEDPAFLATFEDPEVWKAYLLRNPDIIRGTVVAGSSLADAFATAETQEPTGIVSDLPLSYPQTSYVRHEDLVRPSGKHINHYRPLYEETPAQLQAEEWRHKPNQTEDGQLFFEFHVITQLIQSYLRDDRIEMLPFEIHVEAVDQWVRNNFGIELHHLYKEKRLRKPDLNREERIAETVALTALYRQIFLALATVYYDGAITDNEVYYPTGENDLV